MSECSPDAFVLADRGDTPMNVVAVIQHTSAEYLGLMEDHLEGRRIRFQYYRPFASGGTLPAEDLPADAVFLLGGGPWGSAGGRDLPTLAEEIKLTKARLDEGTIGVGAQILAIAAGGSAQSTELEFECSTARRVCDDALNGFLPEEFEQVTYMRDRPVPPEDARILAVDEAGRPAVFQIGSGNGSSSFGFVGNPGIKVGMVEDLVMEFEEVPAGAVERLESLRMLQTRLEDNLVPIMTGLVQCTSLMTAPKAAKSAG